jgi:Adenylate and Guanylate cyclase catalytic domain
VGNGLVFSCSGAIVDIFWYARTKADAVTRMESAPEKEINHASFMEKTCFPGRIHISSETASLLFALGKETWLTPRTDPIETEGRRKFTTYWVNRAEDETTEMIEFQHSLT